MQASGALRERLRAAALGLALCALVLPAHAALKRVALVVGVADYASAPLKNPLNDARAVATRLSALGFEVTKVENPTRQALEQAIVDFEGRLGPDSVSLFYFAGHGLQVRGRNYLVPVDARMETEREVRVEGVEVGLISSAMEYGKSRINFIILDACRNNPFERRVRGGSRGLAAVDAAGGTLIAYATAPGSVAEDGEGRNSVYTAALLNALSAPGLKAEEVFKRVRVAVARDTGRRQIPWESSSLTGDFVFNGSAAPERRREPPAADADVEVSYWNSVRDSANPAALRSYLARYPKGSFAELAELRLRELESKAAPAPVKDAVSQCPSLAGRWRNTLPDCESVVELSPDGPGRFKTSENGCGNTTGTARQNGREVRIDWNMALCSGYTVFTLDESCARGTGEVVMPANFLACSGRHPVTLERLR